MKRKKLLESFEKVMKKGNELLNKDGIESVHIYYCPVCDDIEILVFDGDDTKELKSLNCWGKNHNPLFSQDFCKHYEDSNQIKNILKYEKFIKE